MTRTTASVMLLHVAVSFPKMVDVVIAVVKAGKPIGHGRDCKCLHCVNYEAAAKVMAEFEKD